MTSLHNRIKETTTTTGTSNVTLLGAVTGADAISSRYQVGEVVPYTIQHRTSDEWEVGRGRLSSASVLVRETVEQSSNADGLVDFTSGTKDVFVSLNARASRAGSIGKTLALGTGSYRL